ncbi:hypothetical protein QOZ80_5BG0428470 [Eleusine coracana subsp. coracana]|nr:hypothetical protein QOZ80_5BG0428470 [Eleusine coracana subsp. coracana]
MDAETRRSEPRPPEPTDSSSVQLFSPPAPSSSPESRREDSETTRAVPQQPLFADDRELAVWLDEYASASDDDDTPSGFGGGEAYANGGFGGVPASAAAIACLDWQEYDAEEEEKPRKKKKRRCRRGGTGGEEEGEARCCTICLVDFMVGDDLNVMPCRHRFHEGCLAKWLALSRLCPCCRYTLPSEEEELKKHGDGGVGGVADQQAPGRRRGNRARRANVRLFGSEWASSSDDERS